MSNGFLKPWQIEQIRQTYAPGTRIELQHMEDPQPVPDGTRGSVAYVDDAGTIHMKWDNTQAFWPWKKPWQMTVYTTVSVP